MRQFIFSSDLFCPPRARVGDIGAAHPLEWERHLVTIQMIIKKYRIFSFPVTLRLFQDIFDRFYSVRIRYVNL